MKRLVTILTFMCLIGTLCKAQNQASSIRGQVFSQDDMLPLSGALVTLGDSLQLTITDENGYFEVKAAPGEYLLKVSFLGMESKSLPVTFPSGELLRIELEHDQSELQEVVVMSTGYQSLPAERVTGSFVSLDEKLVFRKVSSDFIDRLEDVSPGVSFNRGPNTGRDQISIRGRSTLFANTAPLIVVDNFPYDGPLESINPNDIEQITVLKDAAAASIWGARAGNGVIVVTTKSGAQASAPRVSFNSSVNVFEKTDPFYVPQMNMGEFVEIERQLFANKYYRSQENSRNKNALSPVVEALIAERDGLLSSEAAESLISSYKGQDLRRDLADYYYRSRISQQYALSLNGGSTSNTYYFSVGYDRNLQGVTGNKDERWTIQAKNSWSFAKDKLKWSVGLYLTQSDDTGTTDIPQSFPYASLADEQGEPLPIYRNLSSRYISSVQGLGLLDWKNVPLNERGKLDENARVLDGRFQTALTVLPLEGLSATLSYQYWTNRSNTRNRNPASSYYVRDLFNRFSYLTESGTVQHYLPQGDILDLSNATSYSQTLRGVVNYTKEWSDMHRLAVLAGSEIRDLSSISDEVRYYGYNDALGTSSVVDYLTRFPYFYNPAASATIESGMSHSGLTDRFVSFYGNAGYTFRKKFDVTVSIRKDQSNFFGVDANDRGVPLWSAGLGWTLSEEPFSGFLNDSYLKLRMSYGYSGNLDKSLSGLLTAAYYNQPNYAYIPNMPAATVQNPPNPGLRWEKVGITNAGVDFESKSGRWTGTFEYYVKKGEDLIGQYEVPISTGLSRVTGNYAQSRTNGIDLILGARWIDRSVTWKSDFFLSQVKDKVTRVDVDQTGSSLINAVNSAIPFPVEGKPLFSVYSYEWAGLNPDTGNPQGIMDGEVSEEYIPIITTASPETLVYHGPARPTVFGSLRNTVGWKGFSLSVNITYRLGYYYRRRSIDYASLLRGQIGHGDYESRWKNPGDEQQTQIPSMPASASSTRNLFYSNSAILVEKGDHIRLQDIRLGYSFIKTERPWLPLRSAELYGYANNLGILWKASDDSLDPDFQTAKPLSSFALGLKIDF
ncbi:SusC/RagA family TonB-linked outer membrane protein [Algoriphagus aquimarinus]|uniref:TonB-linked outer membrane protein, SusC/RagA family n=1 Tax=Algoriphagus aquimarinus TaxID=237018 RepID=A0A1I1ABZ4_9BACT|nr:SusC/RagA family TonB-linked outer membrane protein [Algoriphagus aquimarinus]SFB35515.1 TonB-linked outer membrane protein, SusC/RagA family [Algoriphagus aquimarinus]